MTVTKTVEESRQNELISKHRSNHRSPHYCIDQLDDPLPLCKELDCIAPLEEISVEVHRLKELADLKAKLAETEERRRDADEELKMQMAVTTKWKDAQTVPAIATMSASNEDGASWDVQTLNEAYATAQNANKVLKANVAGQAKTIDHQAKNLSALQVKKEKAEAKVKMLVKVLERGKNAAELKPEVEAGKSKEVMPTVTLSGQAYADLLAKAKENNTSTLPVNKPTERDCLAASYLDRLPVVNDGSPIAVAKNAYQFADTILKQRQGDSGVGCKPKPPSYEG